MKPSLAPLLAAALAVTAAGCQRDNDASVTVRAICMPTEDCTFGPTCDAQFIGFPTLDVAQSQSLWLVVEVGNQLENNADVNVGRTNTNDALITSAEIDYDRVALPTARVGTAYRVPANGSAVISVEVIPESLNATSVLAQLAPDPRSVEIIANVRLHGRYVHGEDFETGEFPVAIRVCNGCLPVQCGGAPTCPPQSEGQLPLVCQAEPAPEPPPATP